MVLLRDSARVLNGTLGAALKAYKQSAQIAKTEISGGQDCA